MSVERQQLGQDGEDLAVAELRRRGYRILTRNYRCRYGEIDIIAADGETVVFIEVKARRSTGFGGPAAAVTTRKQRQIGRVAQYYLGQQRQNDQPARFDVVAIAYAGSDPPRLELIVDAFDFAG